VSSSVTFVAASAHDKKNDKDIEKKCAHLEAENFIKMNTMKEVDGERRATTSTLVRKLEAEVAANPRAPGKQSQKPGHMLEIHSTRDRPSKMASNLVAV